MENTVQSLTEEINLLNDLSKDFNFDESVLLDAKHIIEVKNKEIIDLGGNAVIFDIPQEIGITKEDLLDRVSKQLKALYPFRNSEKVKAKYNTLNRVFKLKSGITYEDYKEKGEKFVHGGALGNYTNNVLSSLVKTNQFFVLRETDKDPVLKYTTPDNSVLVQVLLPNNNSAFALLYKVDKSTVMDFYKTENLTDSLNFTYSFSPTFDEGTFKNEYLALMSKLAEIEKKYY